MIYFNIKALLMFCVLLYFIHILDYNLSITSPEAIRLRLLRYLLPVIVFSIAFNIPKFMEAQTCWALKLNSTYATHLIQYDQDIQLDLELDVRNETFSSTKGTSFESYGSYVGSRDTTFPVCKHVFERWNTSNFHALYLLLHRDSIMDIELWRPMVSCCSNSSIIKFIMIVRLKYQSTLFVFMYILFVFIYNISRSQQQRCDGIQIMPYIIITGRVCSFLALYPLAC